jgi:hypothetical protein
LSYDLYLTDPDTGEVLQLPYKHSIHGGTYAAEGTYRLYLNVTYNYCDLLIETIGENGIKRINGMTGAESISVLENAMSNLEGLPIPNYWEPAPGNVKQALRNLCLLAKERPDGVWECH